AVITAIDISNDALAVAKQNAEFHSVADRIDFIHGNLFDACDLKMQWDLIVSNPPYIREEEFDGLPRDVRMHEPKEALIAGPRGVEVIERLARESVTRLLCGGWLLIEIGPPEESEQAVDACLHLKRHPTLLDLADIPRVIHAQMQ
ncbi:MAG: peptide chain release factor N(5)-glutamine methyltransferase, partial [Planctomycetaceae bacterium]